MPVYTVPVYTVPFDATLRLRHTNLCCASLHCAVRHHAMLRMSISNVILLPSPSQTLTITAAAAAAMLQRHQPTLAL